MAEGSEHLVASSLLIRGSQVRIPAETQFLLQGFTDGGTTGVKEIISISSGTSGILIHSGWHPSSLKFREKMGRVNNWLEGVVQPWRLDETDWANAD